MTLSHAPVMLTETVDALAVVAGGVYVDGTLGRAGHTAEILRRGAGRVIGIDRDADAVAAVTARREREAWSNLTVCQGCHGDLAEIVRAQKVECVDGIVLDLGVSSPQLDEAERGFSFRSDGPLDMRMDRSRGVTAAVLVNTSGLDELATLFRTLGEEPQARRIARAIVAARAHAPFETTGALADTIARTVGPRGPHHPATRVFQALRMAVNDEVGELRRALEGGLEILKPGGRLAVITFESITDRIVKRFFADHVGRLVSLQAGGSRREGALPRMQTVLRGAVTATDDEISRNPRSRSAKLRAAARENVS